MSTASSEGHRRRDTIADGVGVVSAGGGGQGDRRDLRAVDRQRQADPCAVGPDGEPAGPSVYAPREGRVGEWVLAVAGMQRQVVGIGTEVGVEAQGESVDGECGSG